MSTVSKSQCRNGRRSEPSTKLSKEDRQHLRNYQERCDLLRDRTISVSEGYQTGAYIVGRPGSGKTHTVEATLKKSRAKYLLRNSRMTPMGLYEELASHPEYTIVLDDITSLFGQPQALQILLAASGGEAGQTRLVTYSSQREQGKSFYFSGGLIAISNVPLRRDPLANAFASRVVLLEHEPTDEELAAVMRDSARKGFANLTPIECRKVVEFVIGESRTNDFRLDLRFMVKGLQDFRQFKDDFASRPWQELIRSSMRQILRQAHREVLSKQEQIDVDIELVRRLEEQFPGDSKKQIAESGLKPTTFYERRRLLRGR